MVKEKINIKQTAFLCFAMFFASKFLILPSLFFKENEYGGILCIAMILVVELFILYLLIKIKERYVNLSFYEIFSLFLPKFLIKFIYFLLFIFFVCKFLFTISEGFSFLKISLFEETTLLIFFVCVVPVINALAYKGLQAFARSLEIFFLLIVAGLFLSTTIWISSLSNFGLNIFQNNGFEGFLAGLYNYSFWFGDFIFLFVIIDKITIENNFGRKLMNYGILACIIYIVFVLSFYYIFQSASFFHTSAIYEVTQFSTRIGNVGKLDFIPIGTVMFLFFYNSAMFLYCSKDCLKRIITAVSDEQSLIFINIFCFILFYLHFQNLENMVAFATVYLRHFSAFIGYLIPFILLLFYLFGRGKAKIKSPYSKKIVKNHMKYCENK
ncbi:MAG: GerAB/ArcD/ProY family transporter [Clostridia bacterium]|jgi:spore germination protein KB|nr:GerAB/ArcD/ProY family transporter [Clostridia bacterium]MDD3232333.1 GerAB/ArcD/ProY family transporter [Clostridia bacterium]MDD3862542.1 GerAB/ArcD/ProY family transporter [Clostridia bacterium]MDD4408558.1 GerAB/ArcD/ProY family transporter [Clostridia bacterium]